MHMLVKLIFITAAYMYNIARASGVCGKPELPDNTEPVPDLYIDKNIGETFRIKCAKGYVRKAGTSSLIRCTQENGNAYWHSDLPLKCIPDPRNPPVATTDPRNPPVATTETQSPPQQFTSSTTERTARKHPTLYCTSSPTTGVNTSERTSTISEGRNTGAAFSNVSSSTVGGVTGIILLCLAAVLIFLWLRHRNHRNHTEYHPKPDPYTSYIAVPVCASEHSSAQSNKAENSAEDSVIDKNPGIPQGADTCDELLPQTDS
ncbi:interleukin-15 receptor subunit alpha isoform X4 [Cyprinus carpio]|uniref:Interleukin-15 receptor subunit alpha isoform X4 n=1 Tax=Cyprinus carpio TaxID=7962 RepID=A0A9Q9W7F6_CYPCA|nr:interleukin-15 receptor subunit alpha isoform X4 [Cyprinus carpio]